MNNNSCYDKISEEISKLYNEDKGVEEIADSLSIPRYLVESILIEKYDISFR